MKGSSSFLSDVVLAWHNVCVNMYICICVFIALKICFFSVRPARSCVACLTRSRDIGCRALMRPANWISATGSCRSDTITMVSFCPTGLSSIRPWVAVVCMWDAARQATVPGRLQKMILQSPPVTRRNCQERSWMSKTPGPSVH